MNKIIRASLCLLLASVLGSLLAMPAFALERLHQISGAHHEPETVSHFVILLSPVEGQGEGAREQNVGKRQGMPDGTSTLFSAIVPFEPSGPLTVGAVGLDDRRSAPSGLGAMPLTSPGQLLLQN